MLIKIEVYKKIIQELKPLTDSKFKYDKVRWQHLNKEFSSLITSFEDLYISRQDVIKAYKDFYNGKSGWEKPFLLTMIWGFADTGYGTYRTNNYLSKETNFVLIKEALEAVQKGKLEIAFNKLKTIHGLNISYISKILYFATRACNHTEYALIYDFRVARTLIKLTTILEVFEIVEISPSTKFKDYMKYNAMMHKWSKEMDATAECLEMFLFEQKF